MSLITLIFELANLLHGKLGPPDGTFGNCFGF